MLKTKHFFFILALMVFSGIDWAQEGRLTDDRELFMGVTGTSTIKPNLMILMDNSGSMETVIYHPDYSPKTNYNPNGLSITFETDLFSASRFDSTAFEKYRDLKIVKSFYINRGKITYNCIWNVSATFNKRYDNNSPRRWKIYKNSVVINTGTFPTIGQIISYSCDLSASVCTCSRTVTISNVQEGKDTTGSKLPFWILSVTGLSPSTITDPSNGSTIYVNVHKVVANVDNTVKMSSTADSSYYESVPITLYGSTTESTDGNMYDNNYLYWLAFYANTAQINEVKAWASGANQGKFPDADGVLQEAGLVRIRVSRATLNDLADEVYLDCHLGLTRFQKSGDTGDSHIVSKISSSFNLAAFKTIINNVGTNASGTMLAETMADIWNYFKGGGSYMPNTSKYSSGTLANSPINPYCRNSYVIIITDGQSTADTFDDTRFNNSVFKTTAKGPIVINPTTGVTTSGWGDLDSRDPAVTTDPNYCAQGTCWLTASNGTDYLDDVAYLMNSRDLFPETNTNFKDMIGKQSISTYVIGLTVDNDMLSETAVNGDGQYYTASNATQLKSALQKIINNINLRDFAFAAFTAPKRVTTNVGEGSSYVGYFMPAASLSVEEPIWKGHLQSFTVTDKWCPDLGKNGVLDGSDCDKPHVYETEFECTQANPGITCMRTLEMANTESWDAATELKNSTTARNLYTHDYNSTTPKTMINFTSANQSTLRPLFGLANDTSGNANAAYIIQTINSGTTVDGKILGDIFHSDIAFIGPPLPGKKYLANLNPSNTGECPPNTASKEANANCFEKLFTDRAGRKKVLYVGSNDGILHQFDAATGAELWGFIPDEALPSLKKILVNREYTFTVDGRLSADDIYYRGTTNSWKTILTFGLRHGGNAYYTLDATIVDSTPHLLWKFVDATYSGQSWGKPIIGKIKYYDSTSAKDIDKWVVVVAGGFAFNNENPNDLQGKAVFVIDASSGALLWMIGFNNTNGAVDDVDTPEIETTASGVRLLTKKPEFNYSIPSALTAVDRDSNGYLDTIYFGNVAGHLFKTDISNDIPADWKTYQLFKKELTDSADAKITDVSGAVVTVNNVASYALDQSVIGSRSHAMGVISFISGNDLTISATPAMGGPAFIKDTANPDLLLIRNYDPIFLAPAVAFDNPCYNLWVAFGTGDRTRSRTNPTYGKFVALRDDGQKINILENDLVSISWSGNTLAETNIKATDKWGWYFTFPDATQYEKLFDPDPVILPDTELHPHVYFNTYQRPPSSTASSDDCNAPEDATMRFYDISMDYCGAGTTSGSKEEGRFAGGGMFKDYLIIQGTGELASIPPAQNIFNIKLLYTGGLLFWREKKR